VEGRSALLQNLVKRAYPSYEFFVFAVLCGAILGLGYLLDAQAVLVFGILMAPLMSPIVGVNLAIVSGSGSYFFKSLLAFAVGSLLIFLTGALAGLAARLWLPLTLNQAFQHTRLWWTDLVVLALGAMLLAASFVRSEKKPFLPSVMVAYELFLPLNAAAFGLASQVEHLFLEGLLVFVVHLGWVLLFGALALFFLGFRPLKLSGWLFSLLAIGILFFVLSNLLLTGTSQTMTNGDMPPSTFVADVADTQTEESAADVSIFAVFTCACTAGGSVHFLQNMLRKRGLDLSASWIVKMPENYPPLGGTPGPESQRKTHAAAEQKVERIAQQLQRGTPAANERPCLFWRIAARLIYPAFRWFERHGADRFFRADSKCNGCGLCEKVCPVENIHMKDGAPEWQGRCEQCFACFHWCPQQAVQYGLSSRLRRYHHPRTSVADFSR